MKIKYIIKNVFKHLMNNKLINGVIILSLFLGITFPVITFSLAHTMDNSGILHTDWHNSANFTVMGNINDELITKLKIEVTDIKSVYIYGYISPINVRIDNRLLSSGISGYNNLYVENLNKENIVDGSWFINDENEKDIQYKCVIRRDMLTQGGRKALDIGDEIQILSHSFKITGIIEGTNSPFGNVFIPLKTFNYIFNSNNARYKYTIEFFNNASLYDNINKTESFLIKNNINLLSKETGMQDMLNSTEYSYKILTDKLLLSLLVLPYVLISIVNVIISKTQDDSYNNCIRLMVGARRRDIYIQNIIELSALTFIAICGCLVFSNIFNFINSLMEIDYYKINATSILFTTLFGSILIIILSFICMRRIRKYSIIDVLRN